MSIPPPAPQSENEIYFKTWPELKGYHPEILKSLKNIFYISSSKQNFETEQERQQFFHKWTDYYFETHPESIWLALDSDRTLLGYLMGCFDSAKALEYYSHRLPSYSLFQDLFEDYPAHLHINNHPDARGKGIGSQLLNHFKAQCLEQQLSGIHLITTPAARNVSFYSKNGYTTQVLRPYSGAQLLFMGQILTTQVC